MNERALLLALVVTGCARVPGTALDSASQARLESCRRCLSEGRTWQGPGAGECTANCDLQDTYCYRDHCPGACAKGACGDCLTRDDCERAACRWNQSNEAMWCTGP
ncbi:MAG: hypothetical protein JNM69_18030 [Archangium sp.]|nr:hypothetical protein [Archangium sp.]